MKRIRWSRQRGWIVGSTRARGRPRMRWMDEENEVEQTKRMDCERYQDKRKTKNEVDG